VQVHSGRDLSGDLRGAEVNVDSTLGNLHKPKFGAFPPVIDLCTQNDSYRDGGHPGALTGVLGNKFDLAEEDVKASRLPPLR
jgi:hypothetical protein